MVKPSARRAAPLLLVALVAALLATPAAAAGPDEELRPVTRLAEWADNLLTQALDDLRTAWAALGHGVDPNGTEAAGAGDDPTGDPQLGHGVDPNG